MSDPNVWSYIFLGGAVAIIDGLLVVGGRSLPRSESPLLLLLVGVVLVYVLMIWATYLAVLRATQPTRDLLKTIWGFQLALNLLWFVETFVLGDLRSARSVAILWLTFNLAFLLLAVPVDVAAGWLYTPYFVVSLCASGLGVLSI